MKSRYLAKAHNIIRSRLSVSCKDDFENRLKVGQCIMDSFDKNIDKLSNMTLSYNIDKGHIHLGSQAMNNGNDCIVYNNMDFEHSCSCPSRQSRLHFEEKKEIVQIQKFNIKVATCAYILDQNNTLLLTERPSWLHIFPQAWVLPGGTVEYGESLEVACLREVEEEVGLMIEPENENDDNSKLFLNLPLNRDPIPVTMEPFYLYESVTKNLKGIDDHDTETFPPKTSHLVVFFKITIQESFRRLILGLNSSEVENAAWIKLEDIKDAFNGVYKDIEAYKVSYDENDPLAEAFQIKPNCTINTNRLYPLYRYNPFKQGLGKGHYLACQYLLKKHNLL